MWRCGGLFRAQFAVIVLQCLCPRGYQDRLRVWQLITSNGSPGASDGIEGTEEREAIPDIGGHYQLSPHSSLARTEIVTPELRPATRRSYERLFSESNLILTLTVCFVIVEELNFITNITETIETSQFLENCDNKVRGHPVVTSKQWVSDCDD